MEKEGFALYFLKYEITRFNLVSYSWQPYFWEDVILSYRL